MRNAFHNSEKQWVTVFYEGNLYIGRLKAKNKENKLVRVSCFLKNPFGYGKPIVCIRVSTSPSKTPPPLQSAN